MHELQKTCNVYAWFFLKLELCGTVHVDYIQSLLFMQETSICKPAIDSLEIQTKLDELRETNEKKYRLCATKVSAVIKFTCLKILQLFCRLLVKKPVMDRLHHLCHHTVITILIFIATRMLKLLKYVNSK